MIHVVIDGPNVYTVNAARSIPDDRIWVTCLQANRGKGYATRVGLLAAKSELVAYIDGDLDVHPRSLIWALDVIASDTLSKIGCIYGSKVHTNSKVEYPVVRRALSTCFRLLTRVLFGLPIDDSQTGLKVFRTSAISDCLAQSKEDGFLFDLELMTLLIRDNWELSPAPVEINFNYSSTIRPSSILSMLSGMIRLRVRLNRLGR